MQYRSPFIFQTQVLLSIYIYNESEHRLPEIWPRTTRWLKGRLDSAKHALPSGVNKGRYNSSGLSLCRTSSQPECHLRAVERYQYNNRGESRKPLRGRLDLGLKYFSVIAQRRLPGWRSFRSPSSPPFSRDVKLMTSCFEGITFKIDGQQRHHSPKIRNGRASERLHRRCRYCRFSRSNRAATQWAPRSSAFCAPPHRPFLLTLTDI
jgi:hypothetical protein